MQRMSLPLASAARSLTQTARLTLPDFTPNPGLWWYFFTEMFDHFRAFFLIVFSVRSEGIVTSNASPSVPL